jgi:hypothetical protein
MRADEHEQGCCSDLANRGRQSSRGNHDGADAQQEKRPDREHQAKGPPDIEAHVEAVENPDGE